MKKNKNDNGASKKARYDNAKETFNKLRQFNESKENCEKVKAFEQLGLKYIDCFRKYENMFGDLEALVEQNTAYKKHAVGGECLHRGVLSPSNLDIVVGGCNRGRLLKRSPKGIFNYEYFFDESNRLICSKKYDSDSHGEYICYKTEFLIYDKNTVLGVEYSSHSRRISGINECWFENGMLTRSEYAFISIDSGEIPELSIEIPRYENGRIVSLEWQRFYPPLSLDIKEYNFSMDSEGLLSTYKVNKIYGYKPDFDYGDNPPENWVYQVFKSCKKRTHFDSSQGWI